MTEEKRRCFRLPKEARITCQEITYPLGQSPEFEVSMVDVSEGGVGIKGAPQAFEVGIPIQVALLLPGWHRHTSEFLKYDDASVSRPLTAVGRVTRCAQGEDGTYEVGVEFLDIWEDHWNAMRILMEKEGARLASGGVE